MMRNCCLVTAFLLTILLFPEWIWAVDYGADLPPGSRLLTVVSFPGNGARLASAEKRKLDAMIPELARLDKESFVRIEGHAGNGMAKKMNIEKSFRLATEVERYLRLERNVSLDLYLGAMGDKVFPRTGQFVRVVVYPNRYREQWGITQKVTGGQ
jgi:hypothetical protein